MSAAAFRRRAAPRGSIADLAIVRLADEGVPIRALVRVFRKPFGDVAAILREAVEGGRIIALPAADWPVGSGRDVRAPTIAAERGDVPAWLEHGAKLAFRLTAAQAALVAALSWKGRCSKAFLHERIAPEAVPKIVDVYVCKARAKLAPFQIAIATEWGFGYVMDRAAREAVRGRAAAMVTFDDVAFGAADVRGAEAVG